MEWIDLIKLRRRQTTTIDGECERATKGKLKEPSPHRATSTFPRVLLSLSHLPFCAFPFLLPSFLPAHSFRDLTWRTISYPVIAPLLFPTEDRPIGGKRERERERERKRDAKILDILEGVLADISMTDSKKIWPGLGW